MSVGVYAKAIVGAAVAALASAQASLLSPGITVSEWITIALAGLGTFGTVYVTTNQTTEARPVNVTVNRPDPPTWTSTRTTTTPPAPGVPPVPPDAHP